MSNTEMNADQLAAFFNGNANITPDMLSVMMKMAQIQQKQQKKEEKDLKIKEREKKLRKKEKAKYRPVKNCIHTLKRLKTIEKSLDMADIIEIDDIQADWIKWYKSSVEPYCPLHTPQQIKEVIRNNSIRFIKRILTYKNIEKFGMIATSTVRGRTNFLLKTDFGILKGNHAREYLKYIIWLMAKPINDVINAEYNKINDPKYSKFFVETESSSQSMDAILLNFSYINITCPDGLESIIDYLINELHDHEFATNYCIAINHPDFKNLIVKIPDDVKQKMACTFNTDIQKLNMQSSSEEVSDIDTDSDSDSDSDSD